MLIEQRTYTLKPGTTKSYLSIYESEGLHVQMRHFPKMIGYFHTEIGPLNQIVHIWGFLSYELRLEARSALAADPDWQAYAHQTRSFILAQESRFLTPANFSPISSGGDLALNLPHVVAEVKEAVQAYESALDNNDLAALDGLVWDSEQTIRFGQLESLVGKDEIRAFRSNRAGRRKTRQVLKAEITTYGTDVATVAILFVREDSKERIGRWTQTWMRKALRWKLASAHVSFAEHR